MSRIFLLCFLLFSLVSSSQLARQYSFRHFSVSNGLASNTVKNVVQDSDGFIWLATMNGLQRYDGNSFVTIRGKANDPRAIPGNYITSLFVDRSRNLWLAGDDQKVGILDTRSFSFRPVPIALQKPLTGQVDFMELATGVLLCKIDKSIFQFSPSSGRFEPADQLFPLPPKWSLLDICWDPSIKKYWLSTDSGLVRFDPSTGITLYRNHNPEKDPVIEAFRDQRTPLATFVDQKGDIAFTTWRSNEAFPTIHRFNRKTGRAERYTMVDLLGYHEMMGFLQQRNGRVWAYGMPFFMEWTRGAQPFSSLRGENIDEPPIKFDYAYKAIEDRENNIWIATDNGVFTFNPEAQIFTTYGLLRPGDKKARDLPVQSVIQLDNQDIFVGTWGTNGLFHYDKDFNPKPLPSSLGKKGRSCSVWDMAINKKDRKLWITLQAGELMVYDPSKNKMKEVKASIFNGSTIRQVDEDTSGNMWFGTHNGNVIKWDYKKAGGDPSKGYEFIAFVGMVRKIHYDYQGFVWVATDGNGLVKIDASSGRIVRRFTREGPPGEQLFHNIPSDMTYYDDTTLLVAAGCINIINTRTSKVRFLSSENGLPSNTAESIEKDEKGTVWVGMTNGICRINLKKGLVTYYDRRDGIAYDKFSKAGVQELSDGRIVFQTGHNFLVFDPENFQLEKMPPPARITAVRLGGNILSMDSLLRKGRLVLNYDNTSIGIEFSGLTYLQQNKIHFKYMLENADHDWIQTDKPLEVKYNYLRPGEYTFLVKSENANGVANNEVASFTLVVRPPFWNTWWFYGLVLLLVITILYVIDKERMNRKNSLRNMRSEIAGNLHTEISKTLNNINVLSEIAKIKADKNVEQSKEFIGQISNKSRYMMEAMEDMLWSIDPQNDSMQKTVLRIKELTENIRSSYEVEIDLIVDNKVQLLELDMKFRHELFFFYKEALGSLISSTRPFQVFVNLNRVRSRVMVEILAEYEDAPSDYDERFEKAVRKRVASLSGELDVIAEENSFSAILYIPI